MDITKIKITKLFGISTIEMSMKENKLLLVASNGSGKSTILRIVYFFLSKQWAKLSDIDFEEVEFTIDNKNYKFEKEKYLTSSKNDKALILIKQFPLYSEFISQVLIKADLRYLRSNPNSLTLLAENGDIPIGLLMKMLNELDSNKEFLKAFDWEESILYLPTYRRIERSFEELFGDIDERLENYIRDLGFENRRYKFEVSVEESSSGSDKVESEDKLVFNKIFTTFWNERNIYRWRQKKKISQIELVEFGTKDIEFKILELISQAADTDMAPINLVNKFIDACNKYLKDTKIISFDKSVGLKVLLNGSQKEIHIHSLSSGEKQIISIFSSLYLEDHKPIVIIDEPELSLSMRWQESILDDILEAGCKGLIVATHSPFIIPAGLKAYTHGLNEFIV